MPGIKALRKIELGQETTAGTAVAATTVWRGLGTIEDQREVVWPDEDIGYLSGTDRTYTPKLLAALSFEPVEATFEQISYLLAAGLKNVTTGSQDGSGSGYIRTYTASTTAQQTPKTFTIEGGDDQQAEEIEYAFVDSIKLSGKGGEAVMMSADWLGRQVSLCSFTGSSVPTVEEIIFSEGKLYIDAVSGTMGTTQVSNTFLAFDMDIKTGHIPVWTGDGEKYFSFIKQTPPEITCTITFEHDTTGVARVADWRAETARLIRLKFEGSAFTTAGTTYSNKTLLLDMAAKIEKVEKIGEQDGNDIITAMFRARYNSTASKFFESVVVNANESLT